MQTLPTPQDLIDAAARLKGHAHRTPVLRSSTADKLLGATLFFKAENFQRMGAFKFRGAFNALSRFTEEQAKRGVVAFSSGNHAQAIALSARIKGVPAVIVMPNDAPALKIAATREYGAEVVLFDRYTEDREAIGRKISAERGMTLIPPFNHPDVIAGQGTAALELFEDVGELDYLFVCLGGGGLSGGSCLAAATLSPACKVVGVEPEAGNDVQQSLAVGKIVKIEVPKTIADGAQTQAPGDITFPLLQKHLHACVTASDEQLVEAMRFYAERMKMIVEPTGSLSFAAARHAGLPIAGKRVGIIVSGGNVDLASFAKLIQ